MQVVTDQKIIAMARANDALMDGTMKPVNDICIDADVVFGAWPDPTRPSGHDRIVVKGAPRLVAICGAAERTSRRSVRTAEGGRASADGSDVRLVRAGAVPSSVVGRNRR
jgi:hypothetical protein